MLLVPMSAGAQTSAAPGTSGGFIAVAGSRLFYEECAGGQAVGSAAGPALVLVHDGVMGAATWDAVWPALCARFHVVRYDRRGKGRSPAPTAPFSQVADLAALLADRGVARATVVGSSAGGALALDFALAHPDRVERLILLGPVVGGMPTSEHFQARERANFAPLIERGDVEAAAVLQAEDRGMRSRPGAPRRVTRCSPTCAGIRRTCAAHSRTADSRSGRRCPRRRGWARCTCRR